MPRLWRGTIEEHRADVRETILSVTSRLVARDGLHAVTMSRIAEDTGIGRATLYKYFPDVEAVLLAWHQEQIGEHMALLHAVATGPGAPLSRLRAVLEAYAFICHEHPTDDVAIALHRSTHVAHAYAHLVQFVRRLVVECVEQGSVRSDVNAGELANYAVRAVGAARTVETKAAVKRLVAVTLSGLTGAR